MCVFVCVIVVGRKGVRESPKGIVQMLRGKRDKDEPYRRESRDVLFLKVDNVSDALRCGERKYLVSD